MDNRQDPQNGVGGQPENPQGEAGGFPEDFVLEWGDLGRAGKFPEGQERDKSPGNRHPKEGSQPVSPEDIRASLRLEWDDPAADPQARSARTWEHTEPGRDGKSSGRGDHPEDREPGQGSSSAAAQQPTGKKPFNTDDLRASLHLDWDSHAESPRQSSGQQNVPQPTPQRAPAPPAAQAEPHADTAHFTASSPGRGAPEPATAPKDTAPSRLYGKMASLWNTLRKGVKLATAPPQEQTVLPPAKQPPPPQGPEENTTSKALPGTPGHLSHKTHCGPLSLLFSTILPGILLIILVGIQMPTEQEIVYDEYNYGYNYYMQTLLEDKAGGLWAALFAITLAAIVYFTFVLLLKKRVANPVWAVVSLLFCGWMTMLFTSLNDGFSMSTTTPYIVICAVCGVPIFFSMIRVVIWLSPMDRPQSVGKTLLPFMAIPILWYLITNSLRYAAVGYTNTVILLLALVTTYSFVLILLRVLYLLAFRRDSSWKTTRVVILFVLPLLGLMVTQMAPQFSFFWDYSSPVYYLLVVVNGVLMMMPEPRRALLRCALFFGRCCTYVFVLYFFICLAPFYPLSFVGILLFGLGLLVLAPLFLFIYQTKVMVASAKELFRTLGGMRTALCAVLGFCVLPLSVTLSFAGSKSNFGTALSYVDGSGEGAGIVDIQALRNSIDYVHKDGAQMRFNYEHAHYDTDNRPPPPILTQMHNRIMDAEEPIRDYDLYSGLRSTFFHEQSGLTGISSPRELDRDPRIALEEVKVETREEDGFYRSVVHFTMKRTSPVAVGDGDAPLDSDGQQMMDYDGDGFYDDGYSSHWDTRDQSQYATAFHLPDGVFITDYYLDVQDTRKSGILAERTSALWIYDEVVSRALDPGLLYYEGEDIVFCVFPFTKDEVRYTGIEFLHNGPATIRIDGQELLLAPDATVPATPIRSDNGAVFVSAAVKETLPTAAREPAYQFVIDCSEPGQYGDYSSDYYTEGEYTVEHLVERVRTFCSRYGISPDSATVHALNYRRESWPMTEKHWDRKVLRYPVEGGFAVSLVADAIARECEDKDSYPVIVLVTDNIQQAILPTDTTYLAQRSPELAGYYTLISEDYTDLIPFEKSYSDSDGAVPTKPVVMRLLEVDGKAVYLQDDSRPEIVLAAGDAAGLERYPTGSYTDSDSDWSTALRLAGDYKRSTLYPQEERQQKQIEVVKNSFATKIMTPVTSYIVLETEEQEQMMLERQKKLLETGSLDSYIDYTFGEGGMGSEPPLLLCIAVLLPVVLMLQKGRKKRSPAA